MPVHAQAVDLFPHTPRCELIVLLERSAPPVSAAATTTEPAEGDASDAAPAATIAEPADDAASDGTSASRPDDAMPAADAAEPAGVS